MSGSSDGTNLDEIEKKRNNLTCTVAQQSAAKLDAASVIVSVLYYYYVSTHPPNMGLVNRHPLHKNVLTYPKYMYFFHK